MTGEEIILSARMDGVERLCERLDKRMDRLVDSLKDVVSLREYDQFVERQGDMQKEHDIQMGDLEKVVGRIEKIVIRWTASATTLILVVELALKFFPFQV